MATEEQGETLMARLADKPVGAGVGVKLAGGSLLILAHREEDGCCWSLSDSDQWLSGLRSRASSAGVSAQLAKAHSTLAGLAKSWMCFTMWRNTFFIFIFVCV